VKIEILPEAQGELDDGYWFYERQRVGLGEYFLSSVTSDIRSLQLFAGIHLRVGHVFRMLTSRFPYSVFYFFDEETINVIAVVDNRRDPRWISDRLTET
jgi:hypothetical protein